MTSTLRPVVVGVNGTPDSDNAARWAAAEATGLGVPLHVLHAYTQRPLYGPLMAIPVDPLFGRSAAQDVIDETIAKLLAAEPTCPDPVGMIVEGPRMDALLDAAAGASVVVVGARQLGPIRTAFMGSSGGAVAAGAGCPAVIVRGPAGDPTAGAGVVVGVDLGELSEPTLRFAFDHASRYGLPLRAILCWNPGHRLLAHWADDDVDDFRTRGHIKLAEALAGWQEKYPDVTVERQLIDMHPVNCLVAESLTAHLLVIGAHGRNMRARTLLGSVSQAVLHHATCPVAVVHFDD